VHQQPDGPAFDIVLIFHVGCVVVGLVTLVTSRAILVAVVLVAEGVLWPAERRLQLSLVGLQGGGIAVEESVLHDVSVMSWSATAALVLLVAGTVIMLVQP
jgi:hypothetical protein